MDSGASGLCFAALSAVAFAASALSFGVCARRSNPRIAVFMSYAATAALSFGCRLTTDRHFNPHDAWLGLCAGAIVLVGDILLAVAFRECASGVVASVATGSETMLPLASFALLGQRFAPTAWLGVALTLVGVAVLQRADRNSVSLRGVTCAVLAGAAFGVTYLILPSAQEPFGTTLIGVERLVGVFGLVPFLRTSDLRIAVKPAVLWTSITAGACAFLGNGSLIVALHLGPASAIVATSATLVAPIQALAAWAFLREALKPLQWLGIALTCLGIVAVST